jgi:Zn-dependent peptidase ImmA (M78 family)
MEYSGIERYVFNLYTSLGISKPDELSIENIVNKLDVELLYSNFSFRFENIIVIKQDTKQKEWQVFGHELCHYLLHKGNQLNMELRLIKLQEWHANLFSYHFCVPTFMLVKVKSLSINKVSHLFNVEYSFAKERLEMYNRTL